MSSTVHPTTSRTTTRVRVGLVIAALLTLGDIAGSSRELGEAGVQPECSWSSAH